MPLPPLLPPPLVPPSALVLYLVCVAGLGLLLNAALVVALLTRGASGFHGILIQLALSDVLLLAGVSSFETWSRNEGTWSFGKQGCIAYLGMEVFASTASVYFIASLALHALATANMEDKERIKKQKRAQIDDEEIRSSRHSLVANSDSSTPPRTMNIDYRVPNTTVPVKAPVTFVWILAASLSVPEFVLATTAEIGNGYTCTFIDPSHRLNMHILLSVFGFFLPTFLLTTAGILILVKLLTRNRIPHVSGESDEALKLSMLLIGTYFILCAPRSSYTAYHAYISFQHANDLTFFQNPALNNQGPPLLGLILSCLYYSSALLRPSLCMLVLPRLKRVFLPNRICCNSEA